MTTATLSNPPEIAKETIRQLALRKMVPTPENYTLLYGEVSGMKAPAPSPEPPPRIDQAPDALQWSEALHDFLRAWDASVPGLTQAKKRDSLERMLARRSPDPTELRKRFTRLVKSWGQGAKPAREGAAAEVPAVPAAPAAPAVAPLAGAVATGAASRETRNDADRDPGRLNRFLAELVANSVSERLGHSPEQIAEGVALATVLRNASGVPDFAVVAEKLQRFSASMGTYVAGQQEVVTGLTLLLQLLLSNIADLTSDDRWLKGQMERLSTLVGAPMTVHAIIDAHRSMREVISKQGTIKQSLDEARETLKSMLADFVDRLVAMGAKTGDFRGKIEGYASRIEQTDDFARLSEIVRELLSDTRGMQAEVGRTRDELDTARRRAEEYETKVRDLESQLELVSGLVCEDPLTSALNRRGLDEAFQKESARCRRGGQPLSVAVLDVDNFKNLNDRLGHQAGDYALIHLVDVVREAIRPSDVLGRYGGEEFVILLPDTDAVAAEAATVRVQRALTRRFFLHNNERQLITFSAGVAQFAEGETWDTLLDRADHALYEAKRLGKNRVVVASSDATPPALVPARSG